MSTATPEIVGQDELEHVLRKTLEASSSPLSPNQVLNQLTGPFRRPQKELLLQAKKAVERGGWASWVEANCQFSLREAQRYMKLAKEISKLQKEGKDTSAMTLTQALGHLKNLSPNASDVGETSDGADLESCFRLSDTEREQRVKRHAMSPPALPDSATEVAAKVVDKTVTQVRRAIRAGVIKHIQPKIDDGSLEPVDIAMILFESLRAKLTVSMLFDDPETVSPPAETNGRVALPMEPKPEVKEQKLPTAAA